MAQLNDLLSNIYNIKNDIKQVIINKGQNVTNFASYPNAILNIQSGGSGGDILLFSNLNEMNNYSNANLGDLALVYNSNIIDNHDGNQFKLPTLPEDAINNNFFIFRYSTKWYGLMITNTIDKWYSNYGSLYYYDGAKAESYRFYVNNSSSWQFSSNFDFSSSGGLYSPEYWVMSTYNFPYQNGSTFLPATPYKPLQALWQYDNGWNLAPTSLTANKEYVNSAIFWGGNGVETGVLQVTSNLTAEQVKIKAQVYSDLCYLELNSNVANISNIFANRTDLIEIPNINLMNITNMENTFYNCVNLNDKAYNIITNILPNASNLTNQYVTNTGLDINRFTNEQLRILNTKGYIDAIVPEPTVQNYYEIQWE